MGAYDFFWNSIQSNRIEELESQVEDLNNKCEILYEWVNYLNSELQKLQNNSDKVNR